jgi:membrane protease subunit HflK
MAEWPARAKRAGDQEPCIMPSDDNPWNLGGGNRPPANTPPGPGAPWGGGNTPHGRLPPDIERFLNELRRLWQRLMRGGSGGMRGIALGLVVLAAIWLATGFYRVQPDEQGLVLRFGAYDRSSPPGLNYHVPWPVESVLLLPVTRINRVEIGFRSSEIDEQDPTPRAPGAADNAPEQPDRDLREESLMLTGDENIVDINASVFWHIKNAEAYAFSTRNPAGTVKAASESMLRQVLGHTKIQSALTEGRAAIEQAVTAGTQAILDSYKSGVEITQVQLQKVDPPTEVIESFRDVQRANTDADRARNEAQSYANDIVPRARGDSAAIVANAEGDKTAAIARSQGESQRFLSVYAAYAQAKDVTLKRLYIETMQDLLSHAQTTVVDDKLRSLLPTLNLSQPAPGAAK